MIRPLSLLFKTYPDKYCELSLSCKANNDTKIFFNFWYGNKALIFLTIGFVLFRMYMFQILDKRPHELFYPENFFGKILMPVFPSIGLYYFVGVMGLACCLFILFRPENSIVRAILTLILLWLNLLQWSYGFFSCVSHIFILAHFFGIFMPFKINKEEGDIRIANSSISWYLGGLLVTYTLSGIWKVIGLGYKFLIKTEDINWLSPEGALYNAAISFRNYDFPFHEMEKFFSFPFIWQASFLFMLYMQVFCLMAVFRLPWQMWVGVFLLIFHFINAVAFETTFILAPLVVFCLFFPYHLVFKNKKIELMEVKSKIFYGKGKNALYERIYADGSRDRFSGFYAYREEINDRRPMVGGLFYFPFLETITQCLWKLYSPSPKTKKSI